MDCTKLHIAALVERIDASRSAGWNFRKGHDPSSPTQSLRLRSEGLRIEVCNFNQKAVIQGRLR